MDHSPTANGIVRPDTSMPSSERPGDPHDSMSLKGMIIVDAHTHFRQCFDVTSFLDGANSNFQKVARLSGRGRPHVGVLLLTEQPGECGFDLLLQRLDLQKRTGDAGLNNWRLCQTEEDVSLHLQGRHGNDMLVVAGRQTSTMERLEVLAIGTRERFSAGQPTAKLIRDVAQTGALPIVPWSFGKWFWRRGRLLRALLHDPTMPMFFVGDNGNRPMFWPRPALLQVAEGRGIRDLPGSGVLPFSSECRRAGRYGFILEGSLDPAMPAGDLKHRLCNPSTSFQIYGRRENALRFLLNQTAMQVRKKWRKRAHALPKS